MPLFFDLQKVPAISETMARSSLSIRLRRLDLPTFGLPIIATIGFFAICLSFEIFENIVLQKYRFVILNER